MTEQPSFLFLPYKIRRRIYTLLGLVGSTYPSSIYSFPGEWLASEQDFINDDEELSYIPNQLFYVSRAVSEDARAAFYSENTLLSIVVTIGTTRCNYRHGPIVYRAHPDGCHGTVAEIMDNDAQLEANGVLATWRSICSRLAAYQTQDDRFELRLICGAASTETAAAFLAPLHDLPRLKALSIRMGSNRNLYIQHMVMKTIRQKTTYSAPEPEGPFPFLRLPVELQLRVLEHTGFIASWDLLSRAGSSVALGTQSGYGTVVITTVRLPIPVSPLPIARQSAYFPSLSFTAKILVKRGTRNWAFLLTCLLPSKHHGPPRRRSSSASSLLTYGSTCVISPGRLVQQSEGAILLRRNSTFQFHSGTTLSLPLLVRP
ncbi:hypothetical protein BDW72DRAFT_212804 [Aspergillus terricola var. indicus]